MKKILVPCDFSQPAINAFNFALKVAVKSYGTIYLLNVVEPPVTSDSAVITVLNTAAANDLRQKAESQFKALIGDHRVNVVTEVQIGNVDDVILKFIDDESIDLVLMGSHGASGFREFFIGSNAEKIVRRSSAPVLVLKECPKEPIRNIIFPNSLETDTPPDLINNVKVLQDFFDAKLHIVNTPSHLISDSLIHERLYAVTQKYDLKNYTINVFYHPRQEEGILEFAKKMDSDLIAMGTHGRTGIAHLVNGSIAENVVNHSQRPVWTYRMRHEPNLVKTA